MSGLTCISSLPPELLYTILSHALADILFDYLFVGALLLDIPNDHPPNPAGGLDEISSLGRVSVAWRATLHRILSALLHVQSQSLLPTKQIQMQHKMRHRALDHQHHQLTTQTRTTTARAHPSPDLINTPISVSAASVASASTINPTNPTINANANAHAINNATTTNYATIPSLLHHQRTLHTMQIALRDLVQHSIDTYRNEQDQDATMGGGQANQTGVTTPTLLPPPPPAVQVPVQTVLTVQLPIVLTVPTQTGLTVQQPIVLPAPAPVQHQGTGTGTPTPTHPPHSIQPTPHSIHSIQPTHPPASMMSNLNSSAPTQLSFSPLPVHNHLFGTLLLAATGATGGEWKEYAAMLKEYATTPLFQAALCYSQAAVFTCGASNSFSSQARPQPTGRWNIYETTTGGGISTASGGANGASPGMRTVVRRPDLSTLVLTTPRLVTALEWVRGNTGSRDARICPREVCEVVECGMGEVRERIEDAIQVCRWNDLLHAVFLRGERSEEMLEALDGCFDDLETNAGSIQMHHLLRSNLFKTVQTIARLGPISLGPQLGSNNTPSSSPQLRSSTPELSSNGANGSNGEIWRSRAGALAFRWMGRVVEWTGL